MDHHHSSGAITMGVGILLSWSTVCGPTGVSDAVGAIEWTETDCFFKVAQFSSGVTYFQVVILINNRDPGRVVAAILELAQPFYDHGHHLLASNVANNATHACRYPPTIQTSSISSCPPP